MPRRNRNAVDVRGMSADERERYLDSRHGRDWRDLKKEIYQDQRQAEESYLYE